MEDISCRTRTRTAGFRMQVICTKLGACCSNGLLLFNDTLNDSPLRRFTAPCGGVPRSLDAAKHVTVWPNILERFICYLP